MTDTSPSPPPAGSGRGRTARIVAAAVAVVAAGWILSRRSDDAPTIPVPAPSQHTAAAPPLAAEPATVADARDATATTAEAVDAGTLFRDASAELAPSAAPGEAVVLPPGYVAPTGPPAQPLSFLDTLDVIEPVFDFARRQCGTVAFDVRDNGGVGEARFRDDATAACLGPILGPIGFPPPHLGTSGGSGSYVVRSTTAVEYEIQLVDP